MVTCRHCGCQKTNYGLHINMSGAETVIARCGNCGKNPDIKKPFYSKKDFNLSELPILQDDRPESEPCAVCKERRGTQYHHFAPRYLFGYEEADNWPGAYLCQEHHNEWHDKVTPEMRKKGAR